MESENFIDEPPLLQNYPKEAPTALTKQDRIELKRVMKALNRICETATSLKVPLLVDAEQQQYQATIDHLVIRMLKKYNKNEPILFNTYQMYLKSSYNRLINDFNNAKEGGYILGAKIVRGAYIVSERERAKRLNIADPIHPNIESTHKAYQQAVDFALNNLDHMGVVIATHNKESVIYTTQQMQKLGLPNNHSRIFFAQLFGMCDHITLPLAQAGYRSNKLLPYGPISNIVPYLTRRIQENTGVVLRTIEERTILFNTLKSRLFNK